MPDNEADERDHACCYEGYENHTDAVGLSEPSGLRWQKSQFPLDIGSDGEKKLTLL